MKKFRTRLQTVASDTRSERAAGLPSRREELRRVARAAWRRLKGGALTPRRAALSVAIGLAIGVTPLWGLHWLLVVAVCVPLRLDARVAYLAANVSLPLVAPFVTFAELEMGSRVLHGTWLALTPDEAKNIAIRSVVVEILVGTLLLAAGLAVAGGLVTYALVSIKRRLARKPA